MFKSLIQRLDETRGFEGGVSMPGFPLPEAAMPEIPSIPIREVQSGQEAPSSTLGFVLSRLLGLKPISQELRDRLTASISQASACLTEVDRLISDCREERVAELEGRHKAIRAQGRKQESVIKQLEGEFGEATRMWNETREAKQRRRHDLETYITQRQALSAFASDSEVTAADGAILQTKEALRQALEEETQAMQVYSAADTAMSNANAALHAIAIVEKGIRSELRGVPYFDADLGLQATPQA